MSALRLRLPLDPRRDRRGRRQRRAGRQRIANPSRVPKSRRQVLQARADGQLARAGEAMQSFPLAATSGSTAVAPAASATRRCVARSLGELIPAGQGGSAFVAPVGMPMARADVRDSVRQANLNGELARAGEAMGPVDRAARAHMSRAEIVAMRTRR